MPSPFTSFAIVPAAGRSARMGEPKLLLPWGEGTIIEAVLAAWRGSRVSHAIVVVHPDDLRLAEICRAAGTDVVVPYQAPGEMKISVQWALRHVAAKYQPVATDAWLLAPADMPGLAPATIDLLLDAYQNIRTDDDTQPLPILAPVHHAQRGHPVLFPWQLAGEVEKLPADAGINRLVDQHVWQAVESPQAYVLDDLDTPDDYRRLCDRYNRRHPHKD